MSAKEYIQEVYYNECFPISIEEEFKNCDVNQITISSVNGYAGGIAAEIDSRASSAILGTIAGDDTILIIPREGFSRSEITKILSNVIENF